VKENPQLYGKGKLKALHLDVSKDKSVSEFAKAVIASEPEGIFALVNNAGVALSGPFEMQDFDQHKALFEVNYFGPVRMMRAFLPSLRNFIRNGSDLHPRIINVASVAGRVIAPALSAYCASKHAIKALSEVIRMEVKPFGIKVNIIEPFFAK
jgi:NAD(P)-dependent dehydrogenase (short-subunit alcohol dehydrogenase family)